jgi:peptidoglycan/LPS O-acetylase OafA/YrhL
MQRSQLIDSLRGFSMIVMVLTHATAYFPSDKVAFTLWNWSNFAVPIFVFCSVYLFLKKYLQHSFSFFSFLRKRFFRLLVPYYVFLGVFLIALFLVSPEKVTPTYLWQSALVIGGVDINWLVLLFLEITLVLPFFIWSYKRSRVLFWLFFSVCLGSTFFLLFGTVPIYYKYIMWLPWSLVLFFTGFYIRFEEKKKFLIWAFFVSVLLFGLSYYLQVVQNDSTVLMHNKYPPNMLYLSFGVMVLLALRFMEGILFGGKFVRNIINFFSKYSYSLYFIHYTILIVVAAFIKQFQLNWWSLFLIVIVSSVLVQYGFNRFRRG